MNFLVFLLSLWAVFAVSIGTVSALEGDDVSVADSENIVYTTWEALLGEESGKTINPCRDHSDCVNGMHCYRGSCRIQPPVSTTKSLTSSDNTASACRCRQPRICRILAAGHEHDAPTNDKSLDSIASVNEESKGRGPCQSQKDCRSYMRCRRGWCRKIPETRSVMTRDDALDAVDSNTAVYEAETRDTSKPCKDTLDCPRSQICHCNSCVFIQTKSTED